MGRNRGHKQEQGFVLLAICAMLAVLALSVFLFSSRLQTSQRSTASASAAVDADILSGSISSWLATDCTTSPSFVGKRYSSQSPIISDVSLTHNQSVIAQAGSTSNSLRIVSVSTVNTSVQDLGIQGAGPESGLDCVSGTLQVSAVPISASGSGNAINLAFPMNFFVNGSGYIQGCNGGFPPCVAAAPSPSPSPSPSVSPSPPTGPLVPSPPPSPPSSPLPTSSCTFTFGCSSNQSTCGGGYGSSSISVPSCRVPRPSIARARMERESSAGVPLRAPALSRAVPPQAYNILILNINSST